MFNRRNIAAIASAGLALCILTGCVSVPQNYHDNKSELIKQANLEFLDRNMTFFHNKMNKEIRDAEKRTSVAASAGVYSNKLDVYAHSVNNELKTLAKPLPYENTSHNPKTKRFPYLSSVPVTLDHKTLEREIAEASKVTQQRINATEYAVMTWENELAAESHSGR